MTQKNAGSSGTEPPEPGTQVDQTTVSVPTWTEVYESAEQWVCWTARRRWPTFGANTQIWACSVADWETNGRRAA